LNQRICAIPALLAAVLAGWVTPADAKRLALIIGNDSYQSVAPLQNARSDAEAVAVALKRDGFTVTLKKFGNLESFALLQNPGESQHWLL
jgi:hypothetical protein